MRQSFAAHRHAWRSVALLPLPLLFAVIATAQAAMRANWQGERAQTYKLLVKVMDENGVAVDDARLILMQPGATIVTRAETDAAGRHEFSSLSAGVYQLKIDKEGFYASTTDDVRVEGPSSLEITMYHQQEITATVNVSASPPAIDPEKTEVAATLTNREILTLPYPSTRDYRKALPLIPGVVAEANNQIHLGGSATYQVFDQLEGFNITQPVTGLLEMRVSPDALRAIDVQLSRSSAQYGKGSGGNLSLTTVIGDDHYRFSATNFVPSFQDRKGLNFSEWTPRATFSGPLHRKKAWFFNGIGAVYNLTIVPELPTGADRNASLLVHNLLKAQVNLNESNILAAGFLINHFHSPHDGLSQFSLLETTTDLRQSAYLATLKDQYYAANKALLEIGFAVNQFHDQERPMGTLPYRISPEGSRGNFFKTSNATAGRVQLISSLTLPSVRWHGAHELKFGIDLDRITYDQFAARNPILILRENRTLSRQTTFSGNTQFSRNNFESSAFSQDRWSISNRLLVEAGLRFDRDTIIRRTSISPRVAATYLLTHEGSTKLSGGVGLYYDPTNLDLITRPLAGLRFEQIYASDGKTPVGPPVVTSFAAEARSLKVPRFTNWSVGLEQQLPSSVYLDVEFLQKRGHDVWAFFKLGQSTQPGGAFELRNDRNDRYEVYRSPCATRSKATTQCLLPTRARGPDRARCWTPTSTTWSSASKRADRFLGTHRTISSLGVGCRS